MNEPVLTRLRSLMDLRERVEGLGSAGRWEPAADWYDEDTHLVLVMDVPGLYPDALELHEDGREVTVAGERGALALPPISTARPQGRFEVTLSVPEAVVAGSAQASLHHGVLTVRFEKVRKTLPALGAGEE